MYSLVNRLLETFIANADNAKMMVVKNWELCQPVAFELQLNTHFFPLRHKDINAGPEIFVRALDGYYI